MAPFTDGDYPKISRGNFDGRAWSKGGYRIRFHDLNIIKGCFLSDVSETVAGMYLAKDSHFHECEPQWIL